MGSHKTVEKVTKKCFPQSNKFSQQYFLGLSQENKEKIKNLKET